MRTRHTRCPWRPWASTSSRCLHAREDSASGTGLTCSGTWAHRPPESHGLHTSARPHATARSVHACHVHRKPRARAAVRTDRQHRPEPRPRPEPHSAVGRAPCSPTAPAAAATREGATAPQESHRGRGHTVTVTRQQGGPEFSRPSKTGKRTALTCARCSKASGRPGSKAMTLLSSSRASSAFSMSLKRH